MLKADATDDTTGTHLSQFIAEQSAQKGIWKQSYEPFEVLLVTIQQKK